MSDILFTGGDPMFMKTKLIAQYFEPFKDPEFLPHIKNLRIGTRALTFWPQRFTTDDDADALMDLLREVKEVGGRHVAIMSHLGHVRELQTDKVRHAIHRLKQEAGCIIRSQSPVMRGINDDAEVWAQKWREEVRLGIVPYYMLMARDTGAQASSTCRSSARSSSTPTRSAPPPASAAPRAARRCRARPARSRSSARRTSWAPTPSCSASSSAATSLGSARCSSPSTTPRRCGSTTSSRSTAWSSRQEAGLPKPCIDEPCQIEWMDEYQSA